MCSAAAAGNLTRLRSYHLAGVDLSQGDASGRTPLHLAALHSHPTIIDFLLQNGAEIEARDMLGKTASDVAKSPECKKLLAGGGV